jgi:hypothetical protein
MGTRVDNPVIFRGPLVNPADGRLSPEGLRFFRDLILKTGFSLTLKGEVAQQTPVEGRTEGLSSTVANLDSTGKLQDPGVGFKLDAVPDGAQYGKLKTTALTNNQLDLSKSGVIGQVVSAKIALNAMDNYSNNATVDSVDNGTNATIRVYGPGGVGTTWHQFIGSSIGPELPAFSGAFNYNTDYAIVFDPLINSFSAVTQGFQTLADGLIFVGAVHTVSAGGGGGVPGGGGSGGGGGGGGGGRKLLL